MTFIEGTHREQPTLFPPCLDDYILPSNPIRFLDRFVDMLNMEKHGFIRARPADQGRPGYNPADLLKLYIYGYHRRIHSSRKLEAETHRNVEVMWLLKGLKPDFKTIADFRKNNAQALKNVFKTFAKLCLRLDLLGGVLIVVDGSKFKAQNALRKKTNIKELRRMLDLIEKLTADYLQELEDQDKEADGQESHGVGGDFHNKMAQLEKECGKITKALNKLEHREAQARKSDLRESSSTSPSSSAPHNDAQPPQADEKQSRTKTSTKPKSSSQVEGTPLEAPTTGKESQGLPAQQSKDRTLDKLAESKRLIQRVLAKLKAGGSTHLGLIDPQAKIMKNTGPKPAQFSYNYQSAVDSKYGLIAAELTTNKPADLGCLAIMAKAAKAEMEAQTLSVIADRGYFTHQDLKDCADHEILTYVPEQEFSATVKQDRFRKKNFTYHSEGDYYECPRGEKLSPAKKKNPEGETTYYWTKACRDCPLRSDCTKNTKGRMIKRWKYEHIVEENRKRVESNPQIMNTRSALAEHPFGILKESMGMATLLGKSMKTVSAELSLAALCFNMKRAMNILGLAALMEGLAHHKAYLNAFFALLFTAMMHQIMLITDFSLILLYRRFIQSCRCFANNILYSA